VTRSDASTSSLVDDARRGAMVFILDKDKRARDADARARARCQRCLRTGVWTYECGCEGKYVRRASATERMRDPAKRQKFAEEQFDDVPDGAGVDERRLRAALGEKKKRRKRRRSRSSSSSSGSSSSSSSSGSTSGSSTSSSSYSSSSSSSSGSDSSSSSSSSRGKKRSSRKR
jgi:hypothetical protein